MHYIDFKQDPTAFETDGLISVPNDFTVWDTQQPFFFPSS